MEDGRSCCVCSRRESTSVAAIFSTRYRMVFLAWSGACLVTVSLADCAALVRLPESIGNLRVLEQLLLRGCKSLVSLPSSVRKLNQMLVFRLCQSLAVLPDLVPDVASPPVAAGNDVGPNAPEDAPLPRPEALLLSNCELLSSLLPL